MDTLCDDLQAAAVLLHEEAVRAMREAARVRSRPDAFVANVSAAARCEAVAARIEARVQEDC